VRVEQEAIALVRRSLRGGERFAITGASGWLGRTALHLIHAALGPDNFESSVVAFASEQKPVDFRTGTIKALPLSALPDMADELTHVLHFGYLTRDRAATMGDAFVRANLGITATVVDALERGLRGLAYASSGAARGYGGAGGLDIAANPYGALKALDELVFDAACRRAGARCVIPRIYSVTGLFMTKPDSYALGSFLRAALSQKTIEVKATRPVWRSYVAATDVIALSMAAMLDDNAGAATVAFDSGGEPIEVGELAERVADVIGGSVNRSPLNHGADEDRYVGDPTEMQTLATTYGLPLMDLDDQIRLTAAGLADADG
jgi:UDP-glucuronate decarboxylase